MSARPMRDALALWAEPGDLTELRDHPPLPLRGDPVALAVATAQAVLWHDTAAEAVHDRPPTPERSDDIHRRSVRDILDTVRSLLDAPLDVPRPAEARVLGRSRTFAVLTVALLRSAGVPARARCGFASYLEAGRWEDHWIVEHWSDVQERWVQCDPELDDARCGRLGVSFDPMDLPAGAFLAGGPMWQEVRAGRVSADVCGLVAAGRNGAGSVVGNVIRDLAALTKQELLPWDVWGAMPRHEVDDALAVRCDRWAELSADPDGRFFELLACITDDDGVRVPDVVRNTGRDRDERWLP